MFLACMDLLLLLRLTQADWSLNSQSSLPNILNICQVSRLHTMCFSEHKHDFVDKETPQGV